MMKNLSLLPLLFLLATHTNAFQDIENTYIDNNPTAEQTGKVNLKDNKERIKEIKRIDNFNHKLEKLMLSKKQIGKILSISVPKSIYKEGITEYKITYLGSINNHKKGKIDFLYWEILSGNYRDSLRGSSYINLYSKNKKMGTVYTGGLYPSAPQISNNNLILKPDFDCDQTQSTIINFTNDFPHDFFLPCNQHLDGSASGDIYRFIYF